MCKVIQRRRTCLMLSSWSNVDVSGNVFRSDASWQLRATAEYHRIGDQGPRRFIASCVFPWKAVALKMIRLLKSEWTFLYLFTRNMFLDETVFNTFRLNSWNQKDDDDLLLSSVLFSVCVSSFFELMRAPGSVSESSDRTWTQGYSELSNSKFLVLELMLPRVTLSSPFQQRRQQNPWLSHFSPL